MARTKTKPGTKQKYTDPAVMLEKIYSYFEDCKGVPATTMDGDYQLDQKGNVVMLGKHPPTPAGLALWLGFASFRSLRDYKERKEFEETIEIALSLLEDYYQGRSVDREGARGAEYMLTHVFGVGKEEREAQRTNVVILPDVLKEYYKTSYDEPKE